MCPESANAFGARAYDELGRPSVRDPGGVVRPTPNTWRLGAFVNRNRTNAKLSQAQLFTAPASPSQGHESLYRPRPTHVVLLRIRSISAAENARSDWVRTLPWAAAERKKAVADSSSGASAIITTS